MDFWQSCIIGAAMLGMFVSALYVLREYRRGIEIEREWKAWLKEQEEETR